MKLYRLTSKEFTKFCQQCDCAIGLAKNKTLDIRTLRIDRTTKEIFWIAKNGLQIQVGEID